MDSVSDSPLVARALGEIRSAPQPTERLARHVFGLSSAPPGLAARMLFELLGDERRVRVDREGVWRLAVPRRARALSGALSALTYVVVDVETTGGSPARGDRIIEVAAVRVERGRVTEEFSTLVNPGRTLSPWISRLTGITPTMLRGAPPFSDVAAQVCEHLRAGVFVAHNASFDWRFLVEEMRRARAMMPEGPRLCTLRLARRALPGVRRLGLDSLAQYYGLEVAGRHRACGDAAATARILLRLLSEAEKRGIETWTELAKWLGPAGNRGRYS